MTGFFWGIVFRTSILFWTFSKIFNNFFICHRRWFIRCLLIILSSIFDNIIICRTRWLTIRLSCKQITLFKKNRNNTYEKLTNVVEFSKKKKESKKFPLMSSPLMTTTCKTSENGLLALYLYTKVGEKRNTILFAFTSYEWFHPIFQIFHIKRWRRTYSLLF